MNRHNIFILMVMLALSWACSQPKDTVREIRTAGTAKPEKVSPEEQNFIDRLVARKVDLLKAQSIAVEASDSGNAADTSRLKKIENDLNEIEKEIASYLTNTARRDYYHDAMDIALRNF